MRQVSFHVPDLGDMIAEIREEITSRLVINIRAALDVMRAFSEKAAPLPEAEIRKVAFKVASDITGDLERLPLEEVALQWLSMNMATNRWAEIESRVERSVLGLLDELSRLANLDPSDNEEPPLGIE